MAVVASEISEGNLEAMPRLTPNSSRASTSQPQLNQSSSLQAALASVPHNSLRKKTPSISPSLAPVAPRKPSPLQNLLASVPDDSTIQSPSDSPTSNFGFFDPKLPPPLPQNLVIPGQTQQLHPGQPQYLAQPLLHVPPRLHHPQLYQQQQLPKESSYIHPPFPSHPPHQFRQQQPIQQQPIPQQDSFVASQYQAQSSPRSAPQSKSDRELRSIQSEYAIQMARQEAGNSKPAVAAKPATNDSKAANPAAVKSKPKAIGSTQIKPVTQAKSKAVPKAAAKPAPKVAPKPALETKITGAQHKKVGRFDWLLRTFLNSLNAIYDEFGGIPDQIKIIDDGVGRHHAQAVVEGYTGEIDGEEGFVDAAPQIDVNKLLIDNSWDASKRLKGLNVPEPMPDSVKLMTSEYSNQGLRPQPSQYTIDDEGKVQLAEPVYQKPEHILHILGHLQNSPLGLTSDSSIPATPSIIVKDGNVTLDSAQWDVVKDCLTVVHYMNDYSQIGKVDMYQEARASWIRMFGRAPGIDEMIQAKQRAHDFREEKGLHTNALATRVWIADEKGARERRDCAVHRPEEKFSALETPATVHAAHVSQAPLAQSASVNAKTHMVPASGLSSTSKAEIVVLRAAVDANGKAFVPTHTAKATILPSMAAHTVIYYPPRQASAIPLFSNSRTEAIELSDDEDEGDVELSPTMPISRPGSLARSQKSFGGKEQAAAAQDEETMHHTGFNPTAAELMDPLFPARHPALYPGSGSQAMSRKRKTSSGSSPSSPGASKRQAMGFGAHPEANSDAEGRVGMGINGMEVLPVVAIDVNQYIRWEEERNRLKKEKNEARLKAA